MRHNGAYCRSVKILYQRLQFVTDSSTANPAYSQGGPIIARPPARSAPPTPPTARRRATRRPPKQADAAPKMPGTPRKKAVIAGPKKLSPRRQPADQLALMQQIITASLEDDKAENIVVLDLAGRASFADRMVVATGLSDRQIAAMATHLTEKLAELGIKRVQIEGTAGSDWILLDAGDIVVHLFRPEARALYALEKMWGADLDEPI